MKTLVGIAALCGLAAGFLSAQEENIRWIRADGKPMEDKDWQDGGWMRTLGMLLFGDAPEVRDAEGMQTKDDDFLLLLNAYHEPVKFQLPEDIAGWKWQISFDTARPELPVEQESPEGGSVLMEARSCVVLRHEQ